MARHLLIFGGSALVNERVSLTGIDYGMFFNQKVSDIAQTGLKVLITTEYLPRIQPWSNSNCFLLFTVGNTEATVTITLFEDVEKWNYGRFLFREYYERIKRFADRHDGVTQMQNDSISIEFYFPKPITGTLQNTLESAWNKFRHCLEETETVLKGGPKWKDEYLTKEKPFC